MAEALLGNAQNIYYGDDKLHVTFFLHPVQDPAATAAEGRPIFKEVEYVRIITPGDTGNIIVRDVQDSDLRRFGRQYEAFKKGAGEAIQGTPLAAWPLATRAFVEEMKHFGVHTVEQLAGMPDSVAGKYRGVVSLKQKAQDFLRAAGDTAPLSKMRTEMEQKDAEIKSLNQAVEEMKKQINDLQKSQRR